MSDRAEVLDSVRRNLAAAGSPCEEVLPDINREHLGSDKEELARRLQKECEAVSTSVHLLHDVEHAARTLNELASERKVAKLAVSHDPLARAISAQAIGAHDVVAPDADKAEIEQSDMGLSGARMAIAEHGTFVLVPDDDGCRLVSLLPPQHVIAISKDQILGTLAEALQQLVATGSDSPPANVTFVSGPSRTADIEQNLVTGIHGPAQLDIFLIDDTRGLTSQ